MGNIMWRENRLWPFPELPVSQIFEKQNIIWPDSQKNHFVQLVFFSSSNMKTLSSPGLSKILKFCYCNIVVITPTHLSAV